MQILVQLRVQLASWPGTMQSSIDTAIRENLKKLGFSSLKEKQQETVRSFVSGSDTFAALPTGYGKSIIYAVLPYVFDQLRGMLHDL